MTQSRYPTLLPALVLTFLFAAAEPSIANVEASPVEPLSCGYSYTLSLGGNPDVTPRGREKTRFELHINDGLLVPKFCDEVVKAFSSSSAYFAFCESGQSPAKITHDIIVNKTSGEIVTIMNFYANRDWVTKLAHYGTCEFGPTPEDK